MATRVADPELILRPQRGDYLEDGMRLFRCESMTKDGAVFEDCFTNRYFAVPLSEIAAMQLRVVSSRVSS